MNDLFFSFSDLCRMREVCRKMQAEPRDVLEKLEQIADICAENDTPLADAGIFVQPSGGVLRGVRPVDGICGYPVKDLVVFARICRKQGITEEQLADYVQDLRMMHDMVLKEVTDDVKRLFAEVSASTSGLSSVPVSGLGLDEKWLRKAQEAREKYVEKRDAADHD